MLRYIVFLLVPHDCAKRNAVWHCSPRSLPNFISSSDSKQGVLYNTRVCYNIIFVFENCENDTSGPTKLWTVHRVQFRARSRDLKNSARAYQIFDIYTTLFCDNKNRRHIDKSVRFMYDNHLKKQVQVQPVLRSKVFYIFIFIPILSVITSYPREKSTLVFHIDTHFPVNNLLYMVCRD